MCQCEGRRSASESGTVLLPNGVIVEVRTCGRCGAPGSREIFPDDPDYDPRLADREVFLEEAVPVRSMAARPG
jgi:hypothetical protein